MTRTLSILLALLVLIGSFLVIRYAKDSYKILPINEKNPLIGGQGNFQDWREFSSPSGSFKILLPSIPQHVTDKITDPVTKEPRKFDMFAVADDNGTAYMVNAITFPEKIDEKDAEDVLRNVVNDMLKRNKENKLKMADMGKFRDFRSLDFVFENNEITVAGKAFLHDKTLYVLSMVDRTNAFKNAEFDFFVNSFDASRTPTSIPAPAPLQKPQKAPAK